MNCLFVSLTHILEEVVLSADATQGMAIRDQGETCSRLTPADSSWTDTRCRWRSADNGFV